MAIGQGAAEHLKHMLGRNDGINYASEASLERRSSGFSAEG